MRVREHTEAYNTPRPTLEPAINNHHNSSPYHQRQRTPATPPAHPAQDLVFVQQVAEVQARSQTSYAIRTHITQKTGINPQSIHAIPVASGWAIRPVDAATRDSLLLQKDDSRELGATKVETSRSGTSMPCQAALADSQTYEATRWTSTQPREMRSNAKRASRPSVSRPPVQDSYRVFHEPDKPFLDPVWSQSTRQTHQ